MKTTDLTPSEIVAWFRAKAEEFNKVADGLEATFKFGPSMHSVTLQNGNSLVRGKALDPDQVAAFLSRKNSARPADIALEFDVPKSDVETLIKSNEHTFVVADRGWVKLKSSTPPQ